MGHTECLFCRIAARTVPAEVVGEADGLLAVKDVNPQAPTHLLIIPTEHIPTLADATDEQGMLLLDLKDLRAMLAHVGENASKFTVQFGNIAATSIGRAPTFSMTSARSKPSIHSMMM